MPGMEASITSKASIGSKVILIHVQYNELTILTSNYIVSKGSQQASPTNWSSSLKMNVNKIMLTGHYPRKMNLDFCRREKKYT